VPRALSLLGPHGEPRLLADFVTGPWTVIQLVRYFGCLPCQEWLVSLDRAGRELAKLGATALAAGGSADYQARWLKRVRGVEVPLLLDPDHTLRAASQGSPDLGKRPQKGPEWVVCLVEQQGGQLRSGRPALTQQQVREECPALAAPELVCLVLPPETWAPQQVDRERHVPSDVVGSGIQTHGAGGARCAQG
jgi:hypothetical protein